MAIGEVDFEGRLKQKIGRPSRVESVAIRFTEAELATLVSAANENATTIREWAREVLLREARSSRTDALFTEIIATRIFLNNVLRRLAGGEAMSGESFDALLSHVRVEKHKAAAEVKQQYAIAGQKER